MDEFKSKLSDDILYLIRIRAIDENVVTLPRKTIWSREALKTCLGEYNENEGYFRDLSNAIGSENGTCRISVTMLKRMFGRAKSQSTILRKKLDYLAFFIAECTWEKLNSDLEDVMYELESHYVSRGSCGDRLFRPNREHPNHVYTSKLIKGDLVTLTFLCGKVMKIIFIEDYMFSVFESQSEFLKKGYTFTVYEISLNTRLHSNKIINENGEVLDRTYDSDLITDIKFDGVKIKGKKHP